MELKTEPCIEIDPSKFVILLGPQFTSTVLKELGVQDRTPVLSFRGIVEQGISLLLETEQFQSDSERSKYEVLYRNAYELDAMFAVRKLAASLKKTGHYAAWLKRVFELRLEAENGRSLQCSPSLQRLLELQRRGALLVYTHCDDVLDRAANMQSILLEDADIAGRWCSGETPGVLRVHGVYWEPGTVKLDCEFYENVAHPLRPSAEMLKKVFEVKHKIVIGFDAPSEDPLQSKFLENFVAESPKHHVFFMSECPVPPTSYLPVSTNLVVSSSVAMVADSSLSVCKSCLATNEFLFFHLEKHEKGKQIEFPVIETDDNQMLGLLVVGKSGATEISKMMFHAPGVNFALMSSVCYGAHHIHTVSIRVNTNRIRDLWEWIFTTENTSLLAKGLLGIVMQSGTFVWLRGKPSVGGKLPTLNSQFMKVSSSGKGLATTSNQEVPMETAPPPESNSAMKAILAQNEAAGKLYPPLEQLPSPKGKKIPRYTVHKFTWKWGGSNGMSPILRPKQNFSDDSAMLSGSIIPKSVLGRRCSLPPMKSAVVLEGESSAALNQLAENITQTTPPDTSPPSYAAIKQALLCDRYKRRQSMQTDPKMLKNLLQSKLVISESSTTPDLVSQRRKSDPGALRQRSDFSRRRELFMDENRNWLKSYGDTIEKKIDQWRLKRQERYRRELLRQQVELSPNSQKNVLHFQLLNSLTSSSNPYHSSASPYHSGASPTLPTATTTSTAQSAFYQPNFPAGGMSPFVFPQTVFPSTTASGSSPSMLYSYSPFITPYTFVNPYSSLLPPSGQPTTYYLPQASATNQQRLLYFIPSTTGSTASSSGISSTPSITTATSSSTLPSLSSLIAPTPIHPPTTPSSSSSSSSPLMQTDLRSTSLSPNSRKRHQSISALLQPEDDDEDVESPPSTKKQRSTSDTTVYYNPYRTFTMNCNHSNGQSMQRPLTTLESHLLRQEVHHNHHHHNGHQQYHSAKLQNGISEESEEQEVEVIVGGTLGASPKQQKEVPAPAPRSQLQLWQFLLELLLVSPNSHLIQWTEDDFEFQINKPTEVAQLWGKCTNNPTMNYEKLARGLRYYYNKGIMHKVNGRKLTFKYAGNVRNYVQMRRSQMVSNQEEIIVE